MLHSPWWSPTIHGYVYAALRAPGSAGSCWILTKLGLRDRIQAVVLAYETGFVPPRHDHG